MNKAEVILAFGGVAVALGGCRQVDNPNVIQTRPAIVTPSLEPPSTIIFVSPTQTNEPFHQEITPDPEGFKNFLPVDHDSLGGFSFKEYLGNPEKLISSWTVKNSIYQPWYKTDTLAAVKYAPSDFLPRWSEFETRSLGKLDTSEMVTRFGKNTTAFIIDSGGAHSLALAYKLAKEDGWQPVPMLRGIPCKWNMCETFGSDQDIAVALYLGSEMNRIDLTLPQDAPPAFIWNTHRSETFIGGVDDSYSFTLNDMPSAVFFRNKGIRNIIYINEAKDPETVPWERTTYQYNKKSDWYKILSYYQDNGFNIFHKGISPVQ